MIDMGILRVEPSHCKKCLHVFDSHSGISGDSIRHPEQDDLTICAYCGTISIFDKDLNLVAMTQQQLDDLKNDDYENWAILQKASFVIKECIGNN